VTTIDPDGVISVVLLTLPGFVASEAYGAQQAQKPPSDFAWGVRSLAASLLLWVALGAEVVVAQRLLGLPGSSLRELGQDWAFGIGLVTGGLVLGTLLGRLENLAPDCARGVRRALLGVDATPTPAPWYDFLGPRSYKFVRVVTQQGPNYFGALQGFSHDPSGEGRELILIAPAPRDGEPPWRGPILLDECFGHLFGEEDLELSDAGGPVWLSSDNVVGIVITEQGAPRALGWLPRHWPWVLAIAYVVLWPWAWLAAQPWPISAG